MKIFKIVIVLVLAAIVALGCVYFFADGFMADLYIKAGDKALAAGDVEKALGKYEKALDRDPENADVCLTAAEWYAQLEDYTKAEQVLSEGIKAVPEDGRLYSKLSAVYVRQDKLLDAVTMLDGIQNETAKASVEALRPAAPKFDRAGGTYNEYFSVAVTVPEDCYCFYAFGEDYPSVKKQNYVEPIAIGDGETALSALSVDMDGNVSRLAEATYTVENVVQVAQFGESAMEQAVRAALGKSDELEIISDEAAAITSLTISGGSMTSLDDLKWTPNLTTLTIENQPGLDWSQLQLLTSLEGLALKNCEITALELDAICAIKTLKTLDLGGNRIAGIDPIASLPALETLNLSMNSLSSIDALGGMTSLKALNITENAVEDISALAELPALTRFNAEDNIISDLTPLSSCAGLEYLNLTRCPVSDITALSGCTALKTLALDFCTVSDLTPLSACAALESLSMNANLVSDVTPLLSCTLLTTLDLTSNSIASLPDLSGMGYLTEVYMSYNAISDVTPFVGMPSLKILNLDYNTITSVAALSGCPMLTSLYCFGNAVTDSGELSYVTVYGR